MGHGSVIPKAKFFQCNRSSFCLGLVVTSIDSFYHMFEPCNVPRYLALLEFLNWPFPNHLSIFCLLQPVRMWMFMMHTYYGNLKGETLTLNLHVDKPLWCLHPLRLQKGLMFSFYPCDAYALEFKEGWRSASSDELPQCLHTSVNQGITLVFHLKSKTDRLPNEISIDSVYTL